MEPIRELGEIIDLFIPRRPINDRNPHEGEVVKPAEQADHPGDIIRMDLTSGKPLIHDGHVWSGFFKIDKSKFLSQGRPNGIQERFEVGWGIRNGLVRQTDNRFYLSFRPKILTLGGGP